MTSTVRFSDLSMSIFDSMLWITEAIFIDDKVILNVWLISMMYLAMAGNMVVSEVVGHKMIVYRTAGLKVVLFEVVVCKTVILEMIAYEIVVLEITVHEV